MLILSVDPTAKSSRIPAWGRSSLTRFFSVRYIIALRYFRMLDRASGPPPLRGQEAQQQKAGHTAATGKFA